MGYQIGKFIISRRKKTFEYKIVKLTHTQTKLIKFPDFFFYSFVLFNAVSKLPIRLKTHHRMKRRKYTFLLL